jgi:Cys-tRNA(Pro)/Cys-tRNA(Cys) deacylase
VTPAVEAAKRAGIPFQLHDYSGVAIGDDLAVFVVPADRQLDLRAAGKRAELAGKAEAERATGYVVGGISPLGQRKRLPATIDSSVYEWETILVSAGRRGLQLELAPSDLIELTGARVAEIAR